MSKRVVYVGDTIVLHKHGKRFGKIEFKSACTTSTGLVGMSIRITDLTVEGDDHGGAQGPADD